MTETTALLQCPFCGAADPLVQDIPPHKHAFSVAALPDHPGSATVECPACDIGLIKPTRAEAIAAWNCRVTPPTLSAPPAPSASPAQAEQEGGQTMQCLIPESWRAHDDQLVAAEDAQKYVKAVYKDRLFATFPVYDGDFAFPERIAALVLEIVSRADGVSPAQAVQGEALTERLPAGHVVLEQADMLDGRVSQTVRHRDGTEYERIVSAEEAYGDDGATPPAGEGREALPDDIRAAGWVVAVHNDYRLNGEFHTFWLFTKGDRAVKGEGRSDAEALNTVRAALAAARKEAGK